MLRITTKALGTNTDVLVRIVSLAGDDYGTCKIFFFLFLPQARSELAQPHCLMLHGDHRDTVMSKLGLSC
jgi:hypothetical protein